MALALAGMRRGGLGDLGRRGVREAVRVVCTGGDKRGGGGGSGGAALDAEFCSAESCHHLI